MATCFLETSIGTLAITGNAEGVTSVSFVDSPPTSQPVIEPILIRAREQLEEYFAGERTAFDLPLSPRGTDFQRQVWQALASIPYGETRSYGEIAAGLGRPGGARAVGAACGKNPLWILIPCHRAVGKDGTLTGYAGGLPRKDYLLRLEKGDLPHEP